ncbi:hypothetical protein EMCRGX_G015374 [Ephydatia muelleri]
MTGIDLLRCPESHVEIEETDVFIYLFILKENQWPASARGVIQVRPGVYMTLKDNVQVNSEDIGAIAVIQNRS